MKFTEDAEETRQSDLWTVSKALKNSQGAERTAKKWRKAGREWTAEEKWEEFRGKWVS